MYYFDYSAPFIHEIASVVHIPSPLSITVNSIAMTGPWSIERERAERPEQNHIWNTVWLSAFLPAPPFYDREPSLRWSDLLGRVKRKEGVTEAISSLSGAV